MRVAQMCLSQAWGGLEMSTMKWADQFRRHGHESFVITRPNGPIAERAEQGGYINLQVPCREYLAPRASLAIRKFLDQHAIEAIYLHSLRDMWILYPALLGRPKIRVLGFARMFLRNISKKDFLHRGIYRRFDHLIALSRPQMKLLLECLPIEETQFVVIPNGVDVQKFSPGPAKAEVRASLGAKDAEDLLVGLIGRLDPQKGQLEFVEAAAHLLHRYPKLRFVLVGGATLGEAAVTDKIRQLIAQEKLTDRVLLTDFRTDIPDVLRALDIFVMPSYEENFANVLLEALASGVASIGTRSGGTPEIIEDQVSGILVAPRDSMSLAEGIQSLVESSELRRQLGQAGRERALKEFDLELIFQRVSKLAGPSSI